MISRFFGTHGEMSIAAARRPSRRKSKVEGQPLGAADWWHGASSLGTPSKGGTAWSCQRRKGGLVKTTTTAATMTMTMTMTMMATTTSREWRDGVSHIEEASVVIDDEKKSLVPAGSGAHRLVRVL